MDIGAGSTIEIMAKTQLNLENMHYYFHKCVIQTDVFNITIVDGGCFSETLQVSPVDKEEADVALQYMAFTGVAEKESQQMLNCQIRMCMDDCEQPTDNSECPENDAYQYTITGR